MAVINLVTLLIYCLEWLVLWRVLKCFPSSLSEVLKQETNLGHHLWTMRIENNNEKSSHLSSNLRPTNYFRSSPEKSQDVLGKTIGRCYAGWPENEIHNGKRISMKLKTHQIIGESLWCEIHRILNSYHLDLFCIEDYEADETAIIIAIG